MATADTVRTSLLKQLEFIGASADHFTSLVDDYVWYWEQEKAMQEDIDISGRTYEVKSATGVLYDKENPSVKNALLYNKQKLSILKELDLNTGNVMRDQDDNL